MRDTPPPGIPAVFIAWFIFVALLVVGLLATGVVVAVHFLGKVW